MSKPISFLFAALSIGIAPNLGAQGAARQPEVRIPPAIVAHTVAIRPKSKGAGLTRPSASQRAPDPSTLVVVATPNGERRLARAKKRTR